MTIQDVASSHAGREATSQHLAPPPRPVLPGNPGAPPCARVSAPDSCVACGKPFEWWHRKTTSDAGTWPLHGTCNPDAARRERERLFGSRLPDAEMLPLEWS